MATYKNERRLELFSLLRKGDVWTDSMILMICPPTSIAMKENPIWKPVLYVRIHIQDFNPATAELNLPRLQPKSLVMITLWNFPRKLHQILLLTYHVLHFNQLVM